MIVKSKIYNRAAWIIKRISVMSSNELLFRLKEQIDILLLYIQFIFDRQRVECKGYLFLEQSRQILPDFKWLPVSDLIKKKLLAGNIPLYGSDWFWRASDHTKRWHIAPENNNVWPSIFFHQIKFRQGNSTGDIRIAWEASRLQHLIALALIVKSSSNSHEKAKATKIYCDDVASWYEQNPTLTGIHYVSSMECALRIISLSISYDLMRDELGSSKNEIGSLVSKLVTAHAAFIVKRMSLHSSAGNHVLAESTGLIFAGVLFSEHPSSNTWLTLGLDIFESEIGRQINDTGFGIEGASAYLIQIIEYAVLCSALLKKFGLDVPQRISKALERGLSGVRLLVEKLGFFPTVGDSDSGYAVSFLFNEVFCETKRSSGYAVNSHILAIGEVSQPLALVFCNGPLGMPPTYGHGHAHALSVQLYFKGQPVLSDPGTYSYTGQPRWREYFRGTKAHNTININDLDQAKQELLFMWSKPYRCDTLLFEQYHDYYICISQHNGYVDQNVLHRRLLIFSPSKGLYVKDFLISSSDYSAELCWNVNGVLDGSSISVADGALIDFKLNNSGENKRIKSNYIVEDGWFSACYGCKNNIKRLVSVVESKENSSFISMFNLTGVREDWYFEAELRASKFISQMIN